MSRVAADDGERTVIFGPPATDEDFEKAEYALYLTLPLELRQIYAEFNGVGLAAEDEPTIWWLVPLDRLADFNENVSEALEAATPPVAESGLFFGDWYNGNAFGFLRTSVGIPLDATLVQWEHEQGLLEDTGLSLLEFLDALAESTEE